MSRRSTKKEPTQVQPAFSLLDCPGDLSVIERGADPEQLLSCLAPILDPPLNGEQARAFAHTFLKRASLVWGPPGTGKTTVLAAAVLAWLEHAHEQGKPVNIGIGSSNWKAIDHLLGKVAKLVEERRALLNDGDDFQVRVARVRSDYADPLPRQSLIEDVPRRGAEALALTQAMVDGPNSCVVGGTWEQLSKLAGDRAEDWRQPSARWFDLLILDEASQVRVAPALAYFLLLKEDGNVVIAGDDRQLGPIYAFDVEETDQGLLDCVFTFMKETHEIYKTQLVENYRTNHEIAEWPRQRFYNEEYESVFWDRRLEICVPAERPAVWPASLPWHEALPRILDPNLPIAVVTYPEISYQLSNPFEAQLIASLAALYRLSLASDPGGNRLWEDQIGVVTPHRAQVSTIRNLLQSAEGGLFADAVPAVDTVDRFQGRERQVILSSYVVSDRDFVRLEEDFILDSRRFNVTLTRAERKFVMVISEALLRYLPHEAEAARDAAHIQLFVERYCAQVVEEIELGYMTDRGYLPVTCQLRGRRSA